MQIGHPPGKMIAAVLGLSSFAAAVLAGWVAGNPGVLILARSLVCMAIGYAVGRVLGWAAEIAASEYITGYRAARPIPERIATPTDGPSAKGEAP